MTTIDDIGKRAADNSMARAVLDWCLLDDCAIRTDELVRAKHALAYLQNRIGNAAMRDLLEEDIARTTAQVRDRVKRSGGRWRTGRVELIVPGPSAEAFHRWYENSMAEQREETLRAGHPEHFVLQPGKDGIEVVENIGETALPWRVFYRSLPDDAFPMPWKGRYPVRFGAEIVDGDGQRVGYTMHQSRDDTDGLHLLLQTVLPEAAPATLIERHLRHFAIEFRNWTSVARREVGEADAARPVSVQT